MLNENARKESDRKESEAFRKEVEIDRKNCESKIPPQKVEETRLRSWVKTVEKMAADRLYEESKRFETGGASTPKDPDRALILAELFMHSGKASDQFIYDTAEKFFKKNKSKR